VLTDSASSAAASVIVENFNMVSLGGNTKHKQASARCLLVNTRDECTLSCQYCECTGHVHCFVATCTSSQCFLVKHRELAQTIHSKS